MEMNIEWTIIREEIRGLARYRARPNFLTF
jgi:hypothetical protein